MIKNRIEKNLKKLKPWAERNKIEAYRLYDRDIPEFPFIVDVYKDQLVIYDKSEEHVDQKKNHFPLLLEALKEIFSLPENNIVIKRRERQEGPQQYTKLADQNQFFTVQETQARLRVNLHDYLDTGLFLDHRPMRQKIYKQSQGKRMLNLFCYTGSVSVFAALGGAQTTSVDMSKNYLEWAEENFKINSLDPQSHYFINEDVLQYLKHPHQGPLFDLIFLDPPTFSNSKKMEEHFEVEKDQSFLVDQCMKRLNSDGVLYFSNNKRKFKLEESLKLKYFIKDITKETLPMDFHDQKIHHCFEIRHLRKKD